MKKFGSCKRIFAILMSAAVAISGIMVAEVPNSYAASTPTVTATAKVNSSSGAYIRKSTTTKSAKVALLKNNTKVQINKEIFASKTGTGATKRWFSVTYNGKKGYMRADVLDSFSFDGVKAKATESLNYRAGAGTGMKRKGTFKKGKEFEVVLQAKPSCSSDVWYKIKYSGKYYYVSGKYVSFVKESKPSTTKPATTTTPSKPSSTTTPSAPTSTPANAKLGATAKVDSTSGAYMRSEATTASNKVTLLQNNAEVKVLREVFTTKNSSDPTMRWYQITSGNYSGFIRADLLKSFSYSAAKANATDALNYRFGAGTGMAKLGTFSKGAAFEALLECSPAESTETWYKISHDSKIYYVSAEYVELGDAVTTTQTKSNAVISSEGGDLIARTAISLAWPLGTSSTKYQYNGGAPTAEFKKALNKVYPNRSSWGAAPKVGASCDVFAGTVIRYSGYDKDMPRGLGNMSKGQWAQLSKSKLWVDIPYNYKESVLQNGDVIIYQRYSGSEHICIYVKIDGKGYLAEAAIKSSYGHISKITSGSKIFKSSDKKKFKVYRAVDPS